MPNTGDYAISDLAEVFSVSRPTVCRTLNRVSFSDMEWPMSENMDLMGNIAREIVSCGELDGHRLG